MHLRAFDGDAAVLKVYAEVSDFEHGRGLFGLRGGRAPERRAYAREKLVHPEGLRDVVVRARVERLNFCLLLAAHGENDDWDLRDGAEGSAELEPVGSRHREVCDDEFGRPVAEGLERGEAVGGDAHVLAV